VLYTEILLALTVVASALLFGRVFCGYVCPYGFLIELFSRKSMSLDKIKKSALYSYILAFGLISIIAGSGFFLVFDPFSQLTRFFAAAFFPLLNILMHGILGIDFLRQPLSFFFEKSQGYLITESIYLIKSAGISAVLFLFPLVLALFFGRAWCQGLCPLGSLLAFLSNYSIFGRKVISENCTSCGRCKAACPMNAVEDGGGATCTALCQLGFECAEVCRNSAITFGIRPLKKNFVPERRVFIKYTILSAAAVSGFSLLIPEKNHIRPPGALKEDGFLKTCSRCSQCVRVCPTKVLQPLALESGLEPLFTPRMEFSLGYCEWNCNECGKVCPTGAIKRISLEEKQRTKIGVAMIDRSLCFPWKEGKECFVCEELCPVPDKAVKLRKVDTGAHMVRAPFVIEEKCIGCGICEYFCPSKGEKAIRVYPL
jgi:MauM/NapG family ferredoxin protein